MPSKSMIVNINDIRDLPPKPFMLMVLDQMSKIYVFLWDKKDDNQRVMLAWKDIALYYSKNTFRVSLRKLNELGLLDYESNSDYVQIELVAWDEIEE